MIGYKETPFELFRSASLFETSCDRVTGCEAFEVRDPDRSWGVWQGACGPGWGLFQTGEADGGLEGGSRLGLGGVGQWS